jgi:hypothetical protein
MLKTRIAILSIAVALAQSLAAPAVGGPPLLCHEIRLEGSASLPWGSKAFDRSTRFDVRTTAEATLRLLHDDVPVLARMETLRRATLYVKDQPDEADELLGGLMTRILEGESRGTPSALAWFDAGYLAACYDQAGVTARFAPNAAASGTDRTVPGLAWVNRAMTLAAGDTGRLGRFQLAAALMTADSRHAGHAEYLRLAVTGSRDQDEAATDLLHWIAQLHGTTLDALRSRYNVAGADHHAGHGR